RQEGNRALAQAERFRKAVHRIRRVGLDPGVAGAAARVHRIEDVPGAGELRHQAVAAAAPGSRAHRSTPVTRALRRRSSAMEMTGKNRAKSRKSSTNVPSDPKSVDQSQKVGTKACQLDGRNDRCRLVTMIMNRSSHMPTLMITVMMKSATGLARTRRNQIDCGTMTLQKI